MQGNTKTVWWDGCLYPPSAQLLQSYLRVKRSDIHREKDAKGEAAPQALIDFQVCIDPHLATQAGHTSAVVRFQTWARFEFTEEIKQLCLYIHRSTVTALT